MRRLIVVFMMVGCFLQGSDPNGNKKDDKKEAKPRESQFLQPSVHPPRRLDVEPPAPLVVVPTRCRTCGSVWSLCWGTRR